MTFPTRKQLVDAMADATSKDFGLDWIGIHSKALDAMLAMLPIEVEHDKMVSHYRRLIDMRNL